jgi:uncharacterized protein (DUF4213/DUF364 family)
LIKGESSRTLPLMPMSSPPSPLAAAVIYPPNRPPEALLAAFAAELAARGFKVGGLLQHTTFAADGRKEAMVVTELDSGRRISIAQPLGKDANSCVLDAGALAEASGALRRAMAAGADVLFVNKFSKSERSGEGLADELVAAMAEGIPVVVAVPGVLIEEWTEFCGGRCELLAPTPQALWRWWGARRLYDDLALGVDDVPVKRVVVGVNWTLVEGPDGVGLAQTPERGTSGCRGLTRPGANLRELAAQATSWNPFEAALGVAACNAHYNRFDLAAEPVNGLDAFDRAEGRFVVVGAFPGVAERLPGAAIIDRRPAPGQYPEHAAEWLLPGADAVLITASTLANRTLPRLLDLARCGRVALVGPGAALTPRLFSYGVEVTSGLVALDADGLARTVAEGGGVRDLKRHCRPATLRRT